MKKINKKMIIFIVLLAITPKLFSRRGVTFFNENPKKIKVMVDHGSDDWKVVLPDKEVFVPTKKYGPRRVYWEAKGVVYATPKYSNPDYIKIYPYGVFTMTEKTIFGETHYKSKVAEKTTKRGAQEMKEESYEQWKKLGLDEKKQSRNKPADR